MSLAISEVNKLPEITGVYLFKDKTGKIIYIGKAVNLKKRVASYFKKTLTDVKTGKLVENISGLAIIEARNEFEALILEAKLVRFYQPKYNISLKDDKQYIYLLITKDEFPRILLARKSDNQGELFGPYTSKKAISNILWYLRHIFPFCSQNPGANRSCFHKHLSLCNPCPADIKKMPAAEKILLKKKYLSNIRNIKKILSGEIKLVKIVLEKKMAELSNQNLFEEAALIRDQIKKL